MMTLSENPELRGAARPVDILRVYRMAAAMLDKQDSATASAIAEQAWREGSMQQLMNALIFEFTKAISQVHGVNTRKWLDEQIIQAQLDGDAGGETGHR